MKEFRSTTVIAVKHKGKISIGADGQATFGDTVAKSTVRKVRKINSGNIAVGFAGSTADAFTLMERFEEKLSSFSGNMKRAAIELAKDWRTDRYLRRLEAMMITVNEEEILTISGNGDVIEPDEDVAAIGSGAMYAKAAAIAMKKFGKDQSAEDIVKESLHIAADICIYTNHNIIVENL